MLIYHPAWDAHHCAYRLLLLLTHSPEKEIELQRIRVWDFYMLFPAELINARLPQSSASRIRKMVAPMKTPYEQIGDAKRLFDQLEPLQLAAVNHLVSRELLVVEKLKTGVLARTDTPLPSGLKNIITQHKTIDLRIVEFLTTVFLEAPLYGKDGVRDRSKLFDTRYDVSRTSSNS